MKHKILLGGGLLLLAAALCLVLLYWMQEKRAGEASARALQVLAQQTGAPVRQAQSAVEQSGAEEAGDEGSEREAVSVVQADGAEYLGWLEIRQLQLALPVQSGWSEEKLALSPCRYRGSVAGDDLIIAGHNYRSQFGGLSRLQPDDRLWFTDAEGRRIAYRVTAVETLAGGAVAEMEEGDWDLTLFTCTGGGRSRLTLRCRREEGEEGGKGGVAKCNAPRKLCKPTCTILFDCTRKGLQDRPFHIFETFPAFPKVLQAVKKSQRDFLTA